ncbi:type II toxin-antitoxin system RelE family toxin [Brasilonema bromeliae]|uniref:Type II toxin-antitoxin system RelE/ParE family toxin n=1 Tax=Brasilonema bromeliae SPC951 TaxID=385972 RepID=A0ABX1P7B0_9CYAN|nr:type II toxin-antitoxin system RelE/ParE family toxin [Brasilonema bromeliae]NMG20275.1 type II toxin-antitoxin system RelE/ParE family toxin [Brasilonema bromeliae SPC951]
MWQVEYTKRFLKDLAALPEDMQARIEPIVFEEIQSDNPFDLGYLEKMKGYLDKYKIRVGDYRIGITVDKQTNTLICQRVAHRKDIYRIFP